MSGLVSHTMFTMMLWFKSFSITETTTSIMWGLPSLPIPKPWDIYGYFRDGIDWFVGLLLTGWLDAIGFFFTIGVETFLFYDNPREIDALNWYWEHTLVVYLFVVFAMMFGYYVVMMLLSGKEEAETQRIVKRLILSGIFLFISRDLFAFFVALTNEIAYGIFPQSYSFAYMFDLLGVLATAGGVSMAALFIAIAGGFGLVITGIIFFIAMAMRMVIIYVVYAILPLLMGLWVVDVGPGKYGKFFADFMIKIAAVMMVLGIFISGILAVGASFGETGDMEGLEMASDYETDDGTVIISTSEYGPDSQVADSHAQGGDLDSTESGIILRLFMFIGSIWLILATMTSLFGMVLSAGSGSAGGTGGFSGHGSGSSRAAAGGGSAGGGAYGAEYAGNTAGSAHVFDTGDGRKVIANPAGGGVVANPDAGLNEPSLQTFGPEDNPLRSPDAAPNPFNTEPDMSGAGVPLKEKADHMLGGHPSSAKDWMSKRSEATKDWLSEKGYAGNVPLTVGNWAKRGAKAYGSVLKQPDVASSLGEAGRIARESPIGKPPVEERAATDQPNVATGRDAFVLGREGPATAGAGAGAGGTGASSEAGGATGGESGTGPSGSGDDSTWWEDNERTHTGERTTQGSAHSGGESSGVFSEETQNIADDLGLPDSYSEIDDAYIEDMYAAVGYDANKLETALESGAFDASPAELEEMIQHQQKMGVPPEQTVEGAIEVISNPNADLIGPHHTDAETLRANGVDVPSDAVSTEGAVRKINLGAEGTGGVNANRTWRYEFADGSTVYAKDHADFAESDGVSSIAGEETINNLSEGTAAEHHFDPTKGVTRSEGIGEASLHEVANGNSSISPEDIDRESLVDAHASSLLAGDTDVHSGNLRVESDGTVRRIDLDQSGTSVEGGYEPMKYRVNRQQKEFGMDVEVSEVEQRMEEMASDFEKSRADMMDRAADRVGGKSGSNAVQEARLEAMENAGKMHGNIEKIKNGDVDYIGLDNDTTDFR